jgi:hypothetical protein
MDIDAALVSVCHVIRGGPSCAEIESMMIIGRLTSEAHRVHNSQSGRMGIWQGWTKMTKRSLDSRHNEDSATFLKSSSIECLTRPKSDRIIAWRIVGEMQISSARCFESWLLH